MNKQYALHNVMSGRFHRKFIVLGTLFAMVPLCFAARALFIGLAQVKDEKKKQIVRVSYPNEPLQIVSLRNEQRELTLNEKFEQETNWLDNLALEFKNDSGRTITYLAWMLDFPETLSSEPLMVFDVFYGSHPIRPEKEYANEPPIPPGDIFEQRIDGKRLAQLKAFIGKRYRLDSLSRVNIRILEIRYSDGTGWNSGSQTKEDPNLPGSRIVKTSQSN